MSAFKFRFFCGFLLLLALLSTPVWAADPPDFTVTAKSAYLRAAPSLSAARTYSVFRDQMYAVVGRTADGLWLKLDFAGASQGTWVLAALGTVKGSLEGVPVLADSAAHLPLATPTPAAGNPPTAGETVRVLFTVTVKSFYGFDKPSLAEGVRVQSLFKGQALTARARTADSQWLQVDVTAAATPVWVRVEYGTVTGDLSALPVAGAPATPAPTPTLAPALSGAAVGPANYPVVPVVSARAREIYQRGLTLGNNPRAFSKVGDCQNVTPFFLAPFDNPADYRLGSAYAYLQDTITNYRNSFTRKSEAVRAGFNVASVLNPMWSNPKNCQPKETPLECEFRLHRPSIVIINMETWWSGAPAAEYEASLRQIVEFSINRGVVPILGTKADNLEKDGGLNAAIVRVAQAYDVPVWNFWLAVQPLPNQGLLSDGFHLTWGRAFFDDPANMQLAWPWRNLTALQALDAVWKSVK